jgi:hypothetical protein|tara:strand:- start:49 stop:306 length:258 start_codon:yes stop_codon:yes gene_type:complete
MKLFTQAETDVQTVYSNFKKLKAVQADKYARQQRSTLAALFAIEVGELIGGGMPRFEKALKALLAAGAIIKSTIGRNTYYEMAGN